MSYVTTCFCW